MPALCVREGQAHKVSSSVTYIQGATPTGVTPSTKCAEYTFCLHMTRRASGLGVTLMCILTGILLSITMSNSMTDKKGKAGSESQALWPHPAHICLVYLEYLHVSAGTSS